MTEHLHQWESRLVADPRWPNRTDTFIGEVYCATCGITEREV